MKHMMKRQNDTIIEKNDLIARAVEKMSYLMKEVKKLQDDNRKIRRKLYENR
jgi:uncharacterized coiled-coil protein SlyX